MDAYIKEYVSLLFPNGRAYNNIEGSEKFNEVIALQIERVFLWIKDFQNQLWYANANFDPGPWEKRYQILVPENATIEERQQTVKSYMIFPISEYRMSLEYIQNELIEAGFEDVIVTRNPTGVASGTLHGNNITGTENYIIGPDAYNSFNITGNIKANYYEKMLLLLMSIKPLETAVYDSVQFVLALAIDETLALAYDNSLMLAINN